MYTLKIVPESGYTKINSASEFFIITSNDKQYKEEYDKLCNQLGMGENPPPVALITVNTKENIWDTHKIFKGDKAYILSNQTGKTIEVVS